MDLKTRLGRVEIEGLVGNAPGPLKDQKSWLEVAKTGTPFVWAGSFCREERPGNAGNVFWAEEAPWMALNSLGLPCKAPGEYLEPLDQIEATGKHVVVDVAGLQEEDFPWLAKHFWKGGRTLCLNITCPNLIGKRVFAYNLEETRRAIASTRDVVPEANLVVTLNPHPDPAYHEALARIFSDERVDAIRLCNTWPNAIVRDQGTLKPVIDPNGGLAGLSGEVLRPIVSGQIVQYRKLLPDIGIVASGGVSRGWHVVHYIADGADCTLSATEYARSGADGLGRIQMEG